MSASNSASTRSSSSRLLGLPLEIRHRIYAFASQTKRGPEVMLRDWFEKQDRAKQIREGWVAPAPPPPAAAVPAATPAQLNVEVSDDEDAIDGDDHAEQDEDQVVADDLSGAPVAEEEGGDADIPTPLHNVMDMVDQTDTHDDNENDSAGLAQDQADSDSTPNTTHATTQTVATPVRPTPHRKWQHVPKLVALSHTKPPPNLLLVCKQMRDEAIAYHFDLCTLQINLTTSIQHNDMICEEILGQLADSAFSPIESIRKVKVDIVWDTAWLHDHQDVVGFEKDDPESSDDEDANEDGDYSEDDDDDGGMGPYVLDKATLNNTASFYLGERLRSLNILLLAMPSLRKVKVTYHDSTDTSTAKRNYDNILAHLNGFADENFDDRAPSFTDRETLDYSVEANFLEKEKGREVRIDTTIGLMRAELVLWATSPSRW